MISKFVFAVVAAVLLQVLPSSGVPVPGLFGSPCQQCTPVTLPLPLPSCIPLGKVYSCKNISLKPTLLPSQPAPCSSPCPSPCAAPPLNPLLLKQLLPILLQLPNLANSCAPSCSLPCQY